MTLTSPQGRPVLLLNGDADAMAAQGTILLHFGEQMAESGAYTGAMASDSAIGVGFSIESLRELARFCAGDLQLVGRRYRSQGAAVNVYAEAVDEAKTAIAKLVPEIEKLDARRQLLEEHIPELEPFVPFASNTVCAHPELFDMPAAPQPLDEDEVKAFDEAIEAERTMRVTELAEVKSDLETDLAGYDGAFDTWEEATNTAVASLEKANRVAADSTNEDIYQYYEFAEKTIGAVGDAVDAISGLAALTGVGAPVAAALQVGNTVLKVENVALSVGRAILPDSAVHRSAGQREAERQSVVNNLFALIPFSGAKKAIGTALNKTNSAAYEMAHGGHGVPGAWSTSTEKHPYRPPHRRIDGTPRTTTYKVPR